MTRSTVMRAVPAWASLPLAIVFEVGGATLLNFAEGFTRPVPTLTGLACFAAAFYLISVTLRRLALAVTYATWAGSGTVLVALVGVVALDEPFGWAKAAGIVLVVAGLVGLNLSGAEPACALPVASRKAPQAAAECPTTDTYHD